MYLLQIVCVFDLDTLTGNSVDKTDDIIAEAIRSLEKDLCTIETNLDNGVVLLDSIEQCLLDAMQERRFIPDLALTPLRAKSYEIKEEIRWMRNKMHGLRKGIAQMKTQRAALKEGRESYLRAVESAKGGESAKDI